MLEADHVAAALGAYQVAPCRIRLVVGAADWSAFRLVALATFRSAFRYLLVHGTEMEYMLFIRRNHIIGMANANTRERRVLCKSLQNDFQLVQTINTGRRSTRARGGPGELLLPNQMNVNRERIANEGGRRVSANRVSVICIE